MKELKAITTVYSYYFPEIRALITGLTRDYPHDIFLKVIKPGLDDFHVPIIEKYLDFQSVALPHLRNFTYRYPTAGSEEGIREILSFLQAKRVKKIYVLKGEYEGYKAVGKTRRIETVEVNSDIEPKKLKKGWWFISNPSARDGNIIPNEFINRVCEAGHQIVYDLTYVGLTEYYKFDLSHPNIFAALVSFSKPYGLFYYRVGFTFSRKEIPSLIGNKWFKNILSLLIAQKIMTALDPMYIPNKYKPVQNKIIEEINKVHKLNIKPGDALLLGYLTRKDAKILSSQQRQLINRFQRGSFYRFCLTPYYQLWEKENK